ncbi:MAG: hypothetical protein L0206_24715 [Actinobacteria bacterium]|nr:hypothetical protein [Actinomycetota bacterium]
MITSDRSESRTTHVRTLEILGYGLIAVGFVLMALGVLEIGGVFNIGLGLALVVVGAPLMFGRRSEPELDEEEFMRQLEDL